MASIASCFSSLIILPRMGQSFHGGPNFLLSSLFFRNPKVWLKLGVLRLCVGNVYKWGLWSESAAAVWIFSDGTGAYRRQTRLTSPLITDRRLMYIVWMMKFIQFIHSSLGPKTMISVYLSLSLHPVVDLFDNYGKIFCLFVFHKHCPRKSQFFSLKTDHVGCHSKISESETFFTVCVVDAIQDLKKSCQCCGWIADGPVIISEISDL